MRAVFCYNLIKFMFILLCAFLFAIGSVAGSFLVASVYRLRAKQEIDDNLSELQKTTIKNDYSRCLNCGYRLKWYDLIPIFSWLSLGGKCRKCKHSIGWIEFVMELSLGVIFVISFVFWPLNEINHLNFLLWLIIISLLTIVFVFDFKWQEIPSDVLYILLFVTFIFNVVNYHFNAWHMLYSFMASGGIYLLLYVFSNGKAVGGADWIIAGSLGLLLNNWMLSLILIFLANLFGTIIVILNYIFKRKKITRIAFGPLLITSFFIIFFTSNILTNVFIHWFLN